MSYRAVYACAWDLAEIGVSSALDRFGSLGLDTVTAAGSYHAGKFLRPHGKTGKVYFPEDGVVYFRPNPTVRRNYADSAFDDRRRRRRRARAHGPGSIGDERLAGASAQHPARRAHPESSVANAFGDRYVYSLCPSAPDARAYAIGFALDVTESYPVAGISLETPGFLPYAHGYHHEFALNRPNRWLDSQLGLCFCEHCSAGAKRVGLRIEALRRQVAADIEAYLASDVDFPDDMAEAFWLADARADRELCAFLDWRCAVVTSLVREIRDTVRKSATVAVIPSVARPTGGAWYEGSDLRALAEVAGIIEACFYEPGAARIRADLHDLKRRLRGVGTLRGILRPAFPDLEAKSEFLGAMRSLGAAGIREVAFYNWGHIRDANLDWSPDGLAELQRAL